MVTTSKYARRTLAKVVTDQTNHCIFIYLTATNKEHGRRIAKIHDQGTLEIN